jgi:hypothetical protein
MKTLKNSDYKNIHNGIDVSIDIKNNFYIDANISTSLQFNTFSKAQLEINWMYEFYFFDIHPFIGYAFGYYLLNDSNISHLVYFRMNGGVLFHLYNVWRKLKIGTELSPYMFIGTNKHIALCISGVFFVRIEF